MSLRRINTIRRRAMPRAARAVVTLSFALLALSASAQGGYERRSDVLEFIAGMVEGYGFDRLQLIGLFARMKPIPSVLQAIAPPRDPGVRSWAAYRARFVEKKRIAMGLSFWASHGAALEQAAARYGIPEEIIVAIIGIETIYGRHTGSFNTFAALATLAFDYPPRAALFRRELAELLLLARDTGRDVREFSGSYAGALGLPQFLPSSLRRFGIDGDGDGRIDIAASTEDAIASVANFLAAHGWQKGGPIAASATVAGDVASLIEEGITPRRTPTELAPLGVLANGAPELPAALIDLATPGEPTEYRLGYQNFYVLTRYNRSSFYAMAVSDLAQALHAARDAAPADR